jgi:glycine/D-amino acid oxidase-like deaminating enzyme
MAEPTSVLVIGSGVFGLTTAWELAKRGFNVTCLDRFDIPSPSSAAFDTHKVQYIHLPPFFLLKI